MRKVRVQVFQIGDYVICSNKGVCEVENITVLNISGADKEKEYYILKPLYSAGSTVYVLIGTIPEIPLLVITNDKMTEQMYKDCMKSNDCQELVKLIKTIHQRKQKRIQAGRKITAVDAKYFHLAEENLYGELAVALDLSREEVSGYITAAINGTKAL